MITGKDLVAWGIDPGPYFPEAIDAANLASARGDDPRAAAAAFVPKTIKPLMPGRLPHGEFLEAEDDVERHNLDAVRKTMDRLSTTPVLTATAVMPDACPAGPVGTIPVGGVAASTALHPGMHSADVCCSVAISVLGDVDPQATLHRAQRLTHFGGGGRPEADQVQPDPGLLTEFETNPFLTNTARDAVAHFATQGDGNHFLFVGRLRSTGDVALVTHHGSRKPGAILYKRGMGAAEKLRRQLSPETPKANAWIDPDSAEGRDYWEAIQIIRRWTKASHFALHDMIGGEPQDRYWNEHNFVFRRGDRYLHGKGATPAWSNYADDASGKVLIPLNMAAPILIAEGLDRPEALGFCPHGAGRNLSRSAHLRSLTDGPETPPVDVRWFSGVADASELPSAYKPASKIEAQIEAFGLARVVDHVDPYGCVMAGDWQANAPWRKRKSGK